MTERGIARDGYKVLDGAGKGNRLCHQRISGAVFEEEYCPWLMFRRSSRRQERQLKLRFVVKA